MHRFLLIATESDVLTAGLTAIVQQGPFAALAYFLLRYILTTFADRMTAIGDVIEKKSSEIAELHAAVDTLPDKIKAVILEAIIESRPKGGK